MEQNRHALGTQYSDSDEDAFEDLKKASWVSKGKEEGKSNKSGLMGKEDRFAFFK